jgi:U4/U6.U5 tri-snRNP component SNU23
MGQTTRIERSTLEQVRARIALLRERTKDVTTAKAFDFNQRLEEVKAKEAAIRAERKAQKKAQKDKARAELAQDAMEQDTDMASMMGFGGFGSTKK